MKLDEWLKASSPSSTAERILEYLLDLPSAEERRDMLPEAFAAADDVGQTDQADEAADSETEQLSTTPLQLLQV